MILTETKVGEILSHVELEFMTPNRFEVQPSGDGFLIQFQHLCADRDDHYMKWQGGGKYYISKHAVESEVVFKALKAALDFAEHEIREALTYKGVVFSNPHTDINKLVEFQKTKPIQTRNNVKSINETELSNI